jgi:prepilin-type processing-associated H-X9-DG protein
MCAVASGLVQRGVIDPLGGPLDKRGDYEGAFTIEACRRLADIRDGTSWTILIAESAGRPQYWQRGYRQVPDVCLSGAPWASRSLLGCRGGTPDWTSFAPCAVNCTNNREVYSFHPGGANVAFADGSVRFLGETIDIRVFAALVTRAGREVVSEGDF